MRLGGTTFSFMWKEPALASMRRLGAIGLREFDVILAPGHLWPEELDAAGRRHLAQSLSREGLWIESLNLPALDFNLGSCLRDVREHGIRCFAAALRLSADLGGRGVVVVPGRVSGLLPPSVQDSMSWLGDSIGTLLRIADEVGQDLLIETHPQTAIPTAEAVAAFVESVGHPRLLVAYDVANAEFIGEDQIAALRRLAPILAQVHLSDARHGAWRHDPIGKGTVRFGEIKNALAQINFKDAVIVEVISADALTDTKATMTAYEACALQ